ncbi:hypothetical protein K7X08_019811 [Anisodus acutangulus]|uniref:Uncharacterized protein n=1 Tax=Anisodus acutangulus TaxID=402998 RepID=A0A9Q1MVY0_9SOLA|nr:hypothetical protein K7X08_019811 [Anisodus acutangulus]
MLIGITGKQERNSLSLIACLLWELESVQERLEFIYDSGLAVGKGSSSGFESLSKPTDLVISAVTTADSSSSAKPQASTPGALFEDKPQSSNDAWRKLHSDPLLMIRQ